MIKHQFMKYRKCLCLAALTLLALQPMQARRLKLMTYNIHHAEGMDKKYAPERIAQIIKEYQPDVVALQEVDSATQRVGRQYVAGEIARHTGLHDTYAGAIPFQGGKYGIALLSRKAPKHVERISLPGREEKRTLLIADFGRYVACCTHLSLTEKDRTESIAIIHKALEKYQDKTVFLMGDFNGSPQENFYQVLTKHFRVLNSTDTPTFPYDKPREMIDYIVTREGSAKPSVTKTWITVGNPASDHCPVMVKVKY